MTITEWFDCTNIEHIKAWKHLQPHGRWPQGFIPQDINLTAYWVPMISMKLADHYIDIMLDSQSKE